MKAIIALNTGDTKGEEELLLKSFNYVEPVKGVYKGVSEDSYIVTIEPGEHYSNQMRQLMLIGDIFKQESILLVHDNEGYEAELYFIESGETVSIGTFESEIDGSLPEGITDYTQSKQTGKYYFVR